ncbi:MAG TPA: DUF6640 family protein [Longimicrobium sp.]|nr:DUF6640 family protein [Longimicrobium sp.]
MTATPISAVAPAVPPLAASRRTPRILITVVGVLTPLLTLVADTNRTHLFNPDWTLHSRFHAALWVGANVLAGAGALYLVWGRHRERDSWLALRAAAFMLWMIWVPFFPALLMPDTSAWPDGAPRFLFVSPQVIIAGIFVGLCALAVRLDGRTRTAEAPRAG